MRGFRNLPPDSVRHKIQKENPELSPEEVEEVRVFLEQQREDDPFAVLQEPEERESSSLIITNLAPNYEISLYLAQITGSVIITDSRIRWQEFNFGISDRIENSRQDLLDLYTVFDDLVLPFHTDLQTNIDQYFNGKCGKVRKCIREIFNLLKNGEYDMHSQQLQRISSELQDGVRESMVPPANEDDHVFRTKFYPLAVRGGITNKTVQRLLVSSGSEVHLSSTPLVLFMERIFEE